MLINDAVVPVIFQLRAFGALAVQITADVQSVSEAPIPVVETSLRSERGSTCSCGLMETFEVVFPCCRLQNVTEMK